MHSIFVEVDLILSSASAVPFRSRWKSAGKTELHKCFFHKQHYKHMPIMISMTCFERKCHALRFSSALFPNQRFDVLLAVCRQQTAQCSLWPESTAFSSSSEVICHKLTVFIWPLWTLELTCVVLFSSCSDTHVDHITLPCSPDFSNSTFTLDFPPKFHFLFFSLGLDGFTSFRCSCCFLYHLSSS